jgi:hypothetical protein
MPDQDDERTVETPAESSPAHPDSKPEDDLDLPEGQLVGEHSQDGNDVEGEHAWQPPDPLDPAHQRHCFVVMPYGRDPKEIRWFKGWYEEVIQQAVEEAGYEARLAFNEERPNAIGDEIRTHLAFDPMVVVDLGGATPQEPPNPNVMYELGLRHAFNLPLVMMAWRNQPLPFDIRNQRVIMEDRDLLDLRVTRSRLVSFISSARQGDFYRPMEAVGRIAALDTALQQFGPESVLGALTREVRELRVSFSRPLSAQPKAPTPKKKKTKTRSKPFVMAHLLTDDEKQRLKTLYQARGGSASGWGHLMAADIDAFGNEPRKWTLGEWLRFVSQAAGAHIPNKLSDEELAAMIGAVPLPESEEAAEDVLVVPEESAPPDSEGEETRDQRAEVGSADLTSLEPIDPG